MLSVDTVYRDDMSQYVDELELADTVDDPVAVSLPEFTEMWDAAYSLYASGHTRERREQRQALLETYRDAAYDVVADHGFVMDVPDIEYEELSAILTGGTHNPVANTVRVGQMEDRSLHGNTSLISIIAHECVELWEQQEYILPDDPAVIEQHDGLYSSIRRDSSVPYTGESWVKETMNAYSPGWVKTLYHHAGDTMDDVLRTADDQDEIEAVLYPAAVEAGLPTVPSKIVFEAFNTVWTAYTEEYLEDPDRLEQWMDETERIYTACQGYPPMAGRDIRALADALVDVGDLTDVDDPRDAVLELYSSLPVMLNDQQETVLYRNRRHDMMAGLGATIENQDHVTG